MSDEKTKVSDEAGAEVSEGSETETSEVVGAEEAVTSEESEGEEKAEEASEAAEENADETQAAEGTEKEADEKNQTEKKKLFGRKDKKDKKDEKIEELTDQVRRQLAEFENFRNRSEREKNQMFEIGAKSVLEKMLPVVDNFERGFAGVDENSEDPFVKGMAQVYKQLETALKDLGVEAIPAVGEDFDPNLHNAVMQAQSDELESGKVAAELQKGYKYHDTVLRHSMVSVVQ